MFETLAAENSLRVEDKISALQSYLILFERHSYSNSKARCENQNSSLCGLRKYSLRENKTFRNTGQRTKEGPVPPMPPLPEPRVG
ncbi:hypothetical protein E2C01_004730 [Portunus trituberculatus]|uniref:Uncharacterized protein n=1 Tax=Portunus trituberculatus TaxID=210409 RepID=A0A5B7CX74_PORTR|nr:hypothetical protein [Portunus trituberculatus]